MNIGPAEILVILIFALIIVGPDRLPKVGKTLGKAIGQYKEASNKVNDKLKEEGLDVQSIRDAQSNPFLTLEKIEKIADKSAEYFDGGDNDAPAADKASSRDVETAGSGDGAADVGEAETKQPNATLKLSDLKEDVKTPTSVTKLTDKESFVQRKARLEAQKAATQAKATESTHQVDAQVATCAQSASQSVEEVIESAETAEAQSVMNAANTKPEDADPLKGDAQEH